jgi:YD repeat-containing protein
VTNEITAAMDILPGEEIVGVYPLTSSGRGGLQISDTDRNGNATTCAYDAQDRLTRITDQVGLAITLAYGGGGQFSTITDPAWRVTTVSHDGACNVTRITNPDGNQRDFASGATHELTA